MGRQILSSKLLYLQVVLDDERAIQTLFPLVNTMLYDESK